LFEPDDAPRAASPTGVDAELAVAEELAGAAADGGSAGLDGTGIMKLFSLFHRRCCAIAAKTDVVQI
jgi:hypothetical protein